MAQLNKMKEIVKLAIDTYKGTLREKFRELAPADLKNGQFLKGDPLHSLSWKQGNE